jgi:hypothetical protein
MTASTRGRSHLTLLGALTSLALAPTPCAAQTPGMAAPLMIEVEASIECKYGEELVGNTSKAAGIVFGRNGDSVFAVTALHVVAPGDSTCSAKRIHVVMTNPFAWFDMSVLAKDERHDVALLAAKLDSAELVMRGRRWIQRGPEVRGSIFLIGCPMGGECWDDPLEGRLRDRSFFRDSSLWIVQSPLIEDGYSGGPAVSRAGEVVGMTLDYSGQNARVRRWSWIAGWLKSLGYEVTIPAVDLTPAGWTSAGQSVIRRTAIGLIITALPLPTRSGGGSRLAPSFGLRLDTGGDAEGGYWLSLEHISLTARDRCTSCSDRREMRGSAGFLFGMGVAYYPRVVIRSQALKTIHPFVSGGVLLGRMEQLVRRDAPGPVDPSTGLPAREYFSTGSGPAGGVDLAAGLDVPAGGAFRLRTSIRYVGLAKVYSSFGRVGVDKLMLNGGILWALH